MSVYYFASDFHLGLESKRDPTREKKIVDWLTSIASSATGIFLMGDLYDFWHEYKHVIPKGGTRILGALADISDAGIPIHLFTGNRDQWMYGYLEQEIGLKMYTKPTTMTLFDNKIFLAHGDGLGPGDEGYKMIKKLFAHPIARTLYAAVHPSIGYPIATYWSRKSKEKGIKEKEFLGADKEWLIAYCEDEIKKANTFDFFIMGHRHIAIDWVLSNQHSRYINLGDWISYFTYAALDQKGLTLQHAFPSSQSIIRNIQL
jgi:UDP-2,3-diacylglucosamine hydrolase